VPPSSHRFSPRRQLGRTGFAASILGIGDLADRSVPLSDCAATLRRALEAGLNVVDTAPGYEAGYSEQVVGEALRRWPRASVFVIDKVDHPHEPVAPQVEESLGRLGLEHTDLFVFHGVSTIEDWRRIAATGGGMEQLGECVRRGWCRFRGISSHDPDVLREAIGSGTCDVVLFPIGPFADPRYEREVLPLARARGVGTVSFKTFGAGKLLGDTEGYSRPLAARPRGKLSSGGAEPSGEPELPHLSVEECVRYTLTVDPDVALLGMSFPNEQDAAFAAAAAFVPLPGPEMERIRLRATEAVQGKGHCWWNPV
jgi:aryl-alcohol dehydrogenase-like predicted oxidoreductase